MASNSTIASARSPEPRPPLSRRTLVLLVAVIALGAGLRLYGLADRSMWYDESATLAFAERADEPLSLLDKDVTSDNPLLPVLVRAVQELLEVAAPGIARGSQTYDWFMRLVPCILSIAAVALTFVICRAVVKDDGAALVAGLLCAVSPFQIYYAQELKPYALFLAVSLAAMYCMVRALDTDRMGYWAGFALLLALSFYAHFFGVWNFVVFNLYFAATAYRRKKQIRRWALSQAAAVMMSIPIILMAVELSAVYENIGNVWSLRPDLKSGLVTFKAFFAGYSPNASVYWVLFIVASVLFVLGLWALRKDNNALVLFLCVTVVPIAANILAWRVRRVPLYEHRLFIVSGAMSYCVVACGIRALRPAVLRAGAVVVVLALTGPALADHYAHRIHPLMTHRMGVRYKVANRDAAAYVAARVKEGDRIGHNTHFSLFPFKYYLPFEQHTLCLTEGERIGHIRSFPNEAVWNAYGLLPVRVNRAVEGANRFWYVESWWEPAERPLETLLLRGWLDHHLLRLERTPFDGLTVSLYLNNPDLLLLSRSYRVADYGPGNVLEDRLPPQGAGAAGTKLRDAFFERIERSAGDEAQGLGLSFEPAIMEDGGGHGGSAREGGRASRTSFPVYAEDAFTYSFTVSNKRATPCTATGNIYESTEWVEPLEFTRSNGDSDAWRPWFEGAPGASAFIMLAEIGPQTADETIFKHMTLPHGEYIVMAWSRIAGGGHAATARFFAEPTSLTASQDERQRIGVVRGGEVRDWAWRRVGFIRSDGRPFRLIVAAKSGPAADPVRFELGGIRFFPAAEKDATEPQSLEVALGPWETQVHSFSGNLGSCRTKRVDIVLRDRPNDTSRRINFYVSRAGQGGAVSTAQ